MGIRETYFAETMMWVNRLNDTTILGTLMDKFPVKMQQYTNA